MRYFLLFILTLTVAAIASPALAQQFNVDLGEGGGNVTERILQLILLLTVLSLAPSILVMVTSFTRIVVVLSLLRSAIGLQQTPPNSVLISLALFLTLFIMMPTFQESYDKGIKPLINEEITTEKALDPISKPFHRFMVEHVRDKDLELLINVSKTKIESAENVPFHVLVPAFMLSELRRAFEIGFLIFIPFLIIDMMVASTLMALGMMMLPPVLISMPFKLIFFVLIDGWYMIAGSLIKSFG